MTKTVPDAEVEAQVNAWVSAHGPLVQRIQRFDRRRHGPVVELLEHLDLHFTRAAAFLRRPEHGPRWTVLQDPDDRRPHQSTDDLPAHVKHALEQ